jgi:hypothetical protein
MNARRALGILASIGLAALAGCDSSSPRTIHGQINVSDYSLRQPVVLVESSSHSSYVANVAATGRFSITVPAGQTYRVTLADRTAAGPIALVSRILWSAKGQTFVWAKVAKGSSINFGTIRPMNGTTAASPAAAPSSNSQGEDDDSQCDEDDDAQGDEQGPTGSGTTCPMTPPSNPPLCMPGGMGNSSGDQDENCDQDDQANGDDDRDGNGGTCSDGGSGDDNNQGDDNAQGNEDEDDGDGHGCMTHIPTCPPPSGSADMGTTTPPPPVSHDMAGSPIP